MNTELEERLTKEYKETSLFSFLQKNATGQDIPLETVQTDSFGLTQCSIPHLEDYYTKEVLSLFVQFELKTIIPKLQPLSTELVDTKDHIIIGNIQTPSYASYFRANLSEPLCIKKSDVCVDDYDVVFSDYTGINLGQMYESAIKSFIIIGVSERRL